MVPYDGVLFNHKRNEILTHAATWINLENVMLSEKKPVTKDHIKCLE